MRPTTITMAALLLLAGPALAKDNAADEAAIKTTAAAFDATWAKGDAKAFAALFTDDGAMVSPIGEATRGRGELESKVAVELAGRFKGTGHRLTLTTFHFVRPDVAVADGDVQLSGLKTPDGKTMPPLDAKATAVLTKVKGKWLFAELHGYVYMQRPAAPPATAAAR
jgi:uncharacterized protein (TIGR02246 family)